MTHDDVLGVLEENQNPRGMAHWERLHPEAPLHSFGIGLTQLRKLAKVIGRDHDLAKELWESDCYDARVVGLLIDEPKKVTREQAERQVDQLQHGMLPHVFSSCDATLAKTPFAVEVAEKWVESDDLMRKRCAYGLLYEISKDKRKSAPDEAFFLKHVQIIEDTQADAPRPLRMSMGGALMGIGKRSKALNLAALVVARQMGPIPGNPGCDPFDVGKHLTSAYLVKKLGL
jgi:3-methyladenine DNA glycosylase AlkD